MKYKQLTVQMRYENFTNYKPGKKIALVHVMEYNCDDSIIMPVTENSIHATIETIIPQSSQLNLWDINYGEDFSSAWAEVTSSTWFNTNVTGSEGYYITGSKLPFWTLNYNLIESGSLSKPPKIFEMWTGEKSSSQYYVSSSADYNTFMENTSSFFYIQQQRLK